MDKFNKELFKKDYISNVVDLTPENIEILKTIYYPTPVMPSKMKPHTDYNSRTDVDHNIIKSLIESEQIQDAISILHTPIFWKCELYVKPAHGKSVLKWHPDYSYWAPTYGHVLLEDGNYDLSSVNFFIPLVDTDEHNGTIKVAPGIFFNDVYDYDRFEGHYINMKFGQAVAFSEKLMHYSGENKSEFVRPALLLRFIESGMFKGL